MLKISPIPIEPSNHAIHLRLEGRVMGPWVSELQTTCEKVLAEGHLLKLDLAEVEFMDPRAITLLSSLQSRGVTLGECSAFIEAQLETNA